MKLSSLLIPTALMLVLSACGTSPAAPLLQAAPQTPTAPAAPVSEELTLTLTPSRATTLDSGNTGLAGYFCRYAVCAGDDRDNNTVRGLLEFTLPAALENAEILSATLTLAPSSPNTAKTALAVLGNLLVEHVAALEFDAPALSLLGQSNSPAAQTLDVTQAVGRDLGRGLSQYRLRLSQTTNSDDVSNLYRLEVSEPGSPEPSPQAPTLVIRFKAKP